MLKVQEYLRSGKTFEQLTEELGIKVTHHPKLPLVILNYCQIDSPKTNPIVRECRGLVLETNTCELVARSFSRFYNWGEVEDEMANFDFSNFSIQSKEDGSLVVLYYYKGMWMANTRGSFAMDKMQGSDLTWTEGFCKAMGISGLQEIHNFLNPDLSYVLEFCSPWNKVVRRYEKPVMYLLTAFRGEEEIPIDECYFPLLFQSPQRYDFSNIQEIQDYLHKQGAEDPTFEGVVIRDTKNNRWKVKNASYLALHRLKGEGDNLFNPKHLLPLILAGEEDEILTYYPEVTEVYLKSKIKVLEAYIRLLETWADHKSIEDQKAFALAILGKTPFTSIMFSVRRKLGFDQKSSDVKRAWREAESAILKHVFNH